MLKVGRQVEGDLARLQRECGSKRPLAGATELARLAKEYGYIKDASRVSLADLSAIVLGKRLDKDSRIRLSDEWASRLLPDEHKNYAARDVVAGLQIYRTIHSSNRPAPVTDSTPAGISVTLLQNDGKTVIATGVLKSTAQSNVKITKSRSAMSVQSVDCPAAIASEYRTKPSLASFGPPPFDLVVKTHWLRTNPIRDRSSILSQVVQATSSTSGGGTSDRTSTEDFEPATNPNGPPLRFCRSCGPGLNVVSNPIEHR